MAGARSVSSWTTDDVAEWLRQNHFGKYVDLFTIQHKIDGRALVLLTENDLRSPPLALAVLGDIKHLMICLKELMSSHPLTSNGSDVSDGTASHATSKMSKVIYDQEEPANRDRQSSASRDWSKQEYESQVSENLKPEFTKLIVSYLYMFIMSVLSSFATAIVHDRVLDMDKYPPLPDIMLDNVPYIPWAFEACETTALALAAILLTTIILHKHRFIILRRLFALAGTMYMLRSSTLLVTSLPLAGNHRQCIPKSDGAWSTVERTLAIWSRSGLSLNGVMTCGDYIFSGHAFIIMLLHLFITKYTPRRIPMLHSTVHAISWVLSVLALFLILASHEHYTVDVLVAVYVSSGLFLYYHSLANNLMFRQPRTRVWFPLFSYFESSTIGIVPNEYEWPL